MDRDEPGGRPVFWPGGVRHEGGASPVCGFCTERGKADADTDALEREGAGGQRERAKRRKPEALSTVAASRRTGS